MQLKLLTNISSGREDKDRADSHQKNDDHRNVACERIVVSPLCKVLNSLILQLNLNDSKDFKSIVNGGAKVYHLTATILTGHKRKHTAEFTRLISHYLFAPHFCNVRRPNEKGIVEGSVKYSSLNFMVPVPQVKDYDELNRLLRDCCQADLCRILRGKRSLTKQQLLAEDRIASYCFAG
jgi:hypothetical protein